MEVKPIDKEAFNLGFIGAGKLAASVAIGLVNQGILPPSRIFTAHRNPESRLDFTSVGIQVYQNNHQVHTCFLVGMLRCLWMMDLG